MNFFKKKEPEKRWRVDFTPQEDISTYELALCLKWYVLVLSHNQYISGDVLKIRFEEMPVGMKRHFEWIKQ